MLIHEGKLVGKSKIQPVHVCVFSVGRSNLHEFKTESGEIPLGIKSENKHHKQRVD